MHINPLVEMYGVLEIVNTYRQSKEGVPRTGGLLDAGGEKLSSTFLT